MTLTSRSNRTNTSSQTHNQQHNYQQQQLQSPPQQRQSFFSIVKQKGDDAKYGGSTVSYYSQGVISFVVGGLRGSIVPFVPSWLLELSSSSSEAVWNLSFLVVVGMMIPPIRSFLGQSGKMMQRPRNVIGWWITTTVLLWNATSVWNFLGWRILQLVFCTTPTTTPTSVNHHKAWLAGFTLSVFLNGVLFRVFRQPQWFTSNSWWWLFAVMTLVVFGISMESLLQRLSILTITTTTTASSSSHTVRPATRSRVMTEEEPFFDCASHWDDELEDENYQHYHQQQQHFSQNLPDAEMGYADSNNHNGEDELDEDTYEHYQSDQLGVYDSEKGICKFNNSDEDTDTEEGVVVSACVSNGQTPHLIPKSFETYYGPRKAGDRWEETKRWRIAQKVYKIHALPHVHFDAIKQAYFHVIHGKDKQGFPVIYERPGEMNLKDLFQNQGCTVDDMLTHYVYFMEYLSNVVCASLKGGEWGFTVVMDVKGASLRMLSGDVLKYLKQAGDINASHYPCSMKMVLCANSPFWLARSFGVLKGILPANTSLEVMSTSNQIDILTQYIDMDQIPKEYGGASPHPLSEHPLEMQLAQTVQNGLTAPPPPPPPPPKPTSSQPPTSSSLVVKEDSIPKPSSHNDNNLVPRTPRELPSKNQTTSLTPAFSTPITTVIMDTHIASTPMRERSLSSSSQFLPPQHGMSLSWKPRKKKKMNHDLSMEILLGLISLMHISLCTVQGGLEVLIPLWFTIRLQYGPSQCGIVLFSIGMVLLWATRTKVYKKLYMKFPSAAPMTAYRIAVGLSCILLFLFPSSSSSGTNPPATSANTHSNKQQDYNMLGMTCAIIVLTCLFVFLIMARLASYLLHQTASAIFIDKLSLSCDDGTMVGRSLTSIAQGVRTGRFTSILSLFGDVLGAILVAPMYIYFSSNIPFLVAGCICGFLYTTSFLLQIQHTNSDHQIRTAWWSKLWNAP